MPWNAIAWAAAWVASGVAVAAAVRPLGYDVRTWSFAGVVAGPFALPIWAVRRSRCHVYAELVETGSPPRGEVDLLVLPMRGPTPELVRALAELRDAKRRVAIARVVPHDAPRRELAQRRLHLASDRDALGLPSAELVLLFGAPARAVETYAATANLGVALVDRDSADLVRRAGSLRVITPDDVPPAERRDSVRILTSTLPVARVVPVLSARARGHDAVLRTPAR